MGLEEILMMACSVLLAACIALWVKMSQAKAKLAAQQADFANVIPRSSYDAVVQERTTLQARFEIAEKAASERTVLHERAVNAEARASSLEKQLKDQQEQLRQEFSNTATKILETVSGKFATQSEKQIGDLITPLKQNLTDFQKLVTDSFTAQGKEQHTLRSEIQKIVLQADGLTKALRGDVKAQGNWGEVMLERILEQAGLTRGNEYTVQATEMGLADRDGNKLKPDVVVHLPENKHIVVDSKVSLISYDRYCAETDETARALHLKDFLKSVRNHVLGLAQKRYQSLDKLNTPDFVMLFMPIEGAYSLAIQQDKELHSFAWDKQVVIVCPSTLFATMRTIASVWKIENQNRHVFEIAKQSGALYDKFVAFVEDMQTIGSKLDGVQKTYDAALNKLSSGRGNIVGRVEKLKLLGAKTTQSLPTELLDMDEETAVAEPANDSPPATTTRKRSLKMATAE